MENETEQMNFSVPPIYRKLRGYAIDPSLALQLETAPVSQLLFKIPWEGLTAGPEGEYLQVIDYDPAGKCFYEPINLNDPNLLAQDGLPPSEGTPQFHQQMVYAVAQLTIHNFERALGRRTLWASNTEAEAREPEEESAGYVQKLRIYPHALREPNAYYSPAKKSLLFGYFPATESDPDSHHIPGGMVFTCLSHDIIAHETTHALLDGLHRRFNRVTNRDMLAFHEAFADLVALFQHFTFSEILNHQISLTRGDIRSQETLLAQLAGQFGRATGARGALRDAIGKYDEQTKEWKPYLPDPLEYEATLDPHRRGAILVAAIFDAFLSIYNRRIADLLRLYTGGSGILPTGAVHPDLVERLSNEASKTANHVLSMCVRALDYCPPIDLTFGEYLRAIITADVDLVPDDDLNYRVAFVEAFRRRGIYPRDLRTLSVENLIWRRPDRDDQQPSPGLRNIFSALRAFAHNQLYAFSRQDLFEHSKSTRKALRESLMEHFHKGVEESRDSLFLGLTGPDAPFEVESLHFASRTGPDGELLLQAIVQVIEEKDNPEGRPGGPPFEGGCTLVVDLKKSGIAYCIRKPITSKTRQKREKDFFERDAQNTLRSTYFGTRDFNNHPERFALLHRGGV
jgi:hypothetical protein